MLLIGCPYCGPRPEIEFRNGGQAHVARPAAPQALSDQAWADYLHMRDNPRGLHAERWRHAHGCGRFFNAVRHTVTDRIMATYRVGERRPDISPPANDGAAPAGARGEPS